MDLKKVVKAVKVARILAKAGVEVADEITDGKVSEKVEKAKGKVSGKFDKLSDPETVVKVVGVAKKVAKVAKTGVEIADEITDGKASEKLKKVKNTAGTAVGITLMAKKMSDDSRQ